jgi:hypothetical protein
MLRHALLPLFVSVVWITACSDQAREQSSTQAAEHSSAPAPKQMSSSELADGAVAKLSSGQSTEAFADEVPPPWVAELKGDYDLWQDGEGGFGHNCTVSLTDQRTIGGYELRSDESCEQNLDLAGEPVAWFVRDSEGLLMLIDATRRVLLSMQRQSDGTFKDPRNGDYVDAVLLTPVNPHNAQ